MLELPEAWKPEKERKAREDDREEGREEPVGDQEREDRGRSEQAWRVFNLTPPPTPEFSRLGQDPAPIKWEHQLAKLLPPRPSFLEPWADGGQHSNACHGWKGKWSWLGSPAQVSGPGTQQAVGRTQDGHCGASASQPACPRLTKLNFPTLSKGRGCLPPPKKVAELFPQLCRGGGTGGRCLHPDSPPAPVWRLGLARVVRGREERAWGRGAALSARGIGSRRERVNFKSGA